MSEKNISLVINFISVFIIAAVTLSESHLLSADELLPFLVARGLMILAFVLLTFFVKYHDSVAYGLVWTGLFYIYAIVGEYFRPLYLAAIFQIQIIHNFYFKHSKYSYVLVHCLGSALFLWMLFFNWEKNILRLREASIQDQILIIFCSMTCAMLAHFRFEALKENSGRMTKRLALVGSYATSLIHDIKNLSSTPLLYSELLKDKNRNLTHEESERVVRLLNEDLKKMEYLVKELYDSSKISDFSPEPCSLRTICQIAAEIVSQRLQDIDFRIEGDHIVTADRKILQVILLNLFYNSINALKEIQADGPKRIEIVITENELVFTSNSAHDQQQQKNPMGLGIFLMEELARQGNISIKSRIEKNCWVTSLRI